MTTAGLDFLFFYDKYCCKNSVIDPQGLCVSAPGIWKNIARQYSLPQFFFPKFFIDYPSFLFYLLLLYTLFYFSKLHYSQKGPTTICSVALGFATCLPLMTMFSKVTFFILWFLSNPMIMEGFKFMPS